MASQIFRIVPGTDKEYVDAFEAMQAEGVFAYERVALPPLRDVPSRDLPKDATLMEILSQGGRVFTQFTFHFDNNWWVQIQRQQDEKSLFDVVTVNRPDQPSGPQEVLRFAQLIATVQRHLGRASSLVGVASLLGPGAREHFEAREAALDRLERLANDVLVEMEEGRRRRDRELQEKEKALEEKFQQKEQELQATVTQRKQELERRAAELDARKKELDDRAAKHARRQHYKDIKNKFESWSTRFEVSEGTRKLRTSVTVFTLILLLLFAGLAAWFLFQSVTAGDALHLVPAIVKQITFSALFVTTAVFFTKWNNQWFQKHANEEFRLKRMELDIDRASWFVEMAFEWKDEKGEEIPETLIERLTQGLFVEAGGDHAVEPAESLAHALLGAARFKVKLPGDIEVEYDRKGVEKLMREQKKQEKKEKADKEKG